MLRCQDLETRELLPASFTCRNLRSDKVNREELLGGESVMIDAVHIFILKVCNYLFHEIDRKTGRRDVKCNLQGKT